jgi:hypothetical protein
MADGRSPNKAVENLREAMKSWMVSRRAAGLEIPEPRDGAEYSGRILLRMPKSLHQKLSVQAASEGVSLNQHIVAALGEACGRAFQNAVLVDACNLSRAYVGSVGKFINMRLGALWSQTRPITLNDPTALQTSFAMPLAINRLFASGGISQGSGIDESKLLPISSPPSLEHENAPAA